MKVLLLVALVVSSKFPDESEMIGVPVEAMRKVGGVERIVSWCRDGFVTVRPLEESDLMWIPFDSVRAGDVGEMGYWAAHVVARLVSTSRSCDLTKDSRPSLSGKR